MGISVRNNFDSVNLNEIENDIAIIKVKNGSSLPCSRRTIWPACLPNKVLHLFASSQIFLLLVMQILLNVLE